MENLVNLVNEHGSLTDAVEFASKNMSAEERGKMYASGLSFYAHDPVSIALLSGEISYSLASVVDDRDKAVKLRDIDSLTELPKRLTFEKDFYDARERFVRNGVPFAVMIADVDDFKSVNTNYGHVGGDKALKVIAERFETGMRKIDGVYRYAGDEFSGLFSNVNAEQAVIAGNKALERVNASGIDMGDGKNFTPSISAGIYLPGRKDNYEESVARADEAAYDAKDNGKNQVVLYRD